MKIVCRKQGRFLVPVDDDGDEVLAKVKDGRDVMVDVTTPRNIRHHKLFFAMCRFIKEHCELFSEASTDEIKDALKLATGLVERFVSTETAETYYVLKSISFASMDQTKFNQFFDSACQVIANRWLPHGSAPEEVRDELVAMIDGPYAKGRAA